MNNLSKLIITALAFGGSISTASAAGVITDVTASGSGLGSFNVLSNTTNPNELNLGKVFDSLNPITLTFTVGHTEGTGGPYAVTEAITNSIGSAWNDFHFTLSEPAGGNQNAVFTNFDSSTLAGFTLDPTPSSGGPRELNFTGGLADHGIANATFNLNPADPGAGHTATFTLTEVPTNATFNLNPSDPGAGHTATITLAEVPTIPEPETYAMLLAGLGLMGSIVRRRRNPEI